MSTFGNHFKLHEKFHKDAVNAENYEGTRVEAYFLSAYQLIEACAAKERVHINKHQKVRKMLDENNFIFNEDTETAWRSFQYIENQKRPKFAYSMSWTREDLEDVQEAYDKIVKLCYKKLGKR
ncbi:MAG: hypothetical protein ABH834_02240 [Candidatus Altiarchaeota archaeon]